MQPGRTVHIFAIAAGGVGAGLAQLPGSDAPVLVGLQAAMILAIADHYGVRMQQAAAAELALTLGATMTGRATSQVLLGWLPGFGNAVNAATAASVTELIGHAAIRWFDRESCSDLD